MKPVNDSRIAQISGKMLIASSSDHRRQDEEPGDRAVRQAAHAPRDRRRPSAWRRASASVLVAFVPFITVRSVVVRSLPGRSRRRGRGWTFVRRRRCALRLRRILAFLLEDLDPVLDQRVERLLATCPCWRRRSHGPDSACRAAAGRTAARPRSPSRFPSSRRTRERRARSSYRRPTAAQPWRPTRRRDPSTSAEPRAARTTSRTAAHRRRLSKPRRPKGPGRRAG